MQAQLAARMPRREYSGAESFGGSRWSRREARALRVLRSLRVLRESRVCLAEDFLELVARWTFPAGRWRRVATVCEIEEDRRAEREEARRDDFLPSITIL